MPLEAPLRPCPRRKRSTLLSILALWFVFYASFTLFTPPLLDDADSVHAEVAREMLLRHDYITLYANGIRYLEKAPLLYWSMALSFKVFGVSTAASRIPLALTVLALAFTVEAFARRVYRSAHAGLYAALILLSSFGIFIFTRINIPDAMFCLWLTLALYAFWLTEQPDQQERPNLLPTCAFSACCALNVLTKGLIGIVFPAGIVAVYLLLTRGWRGAARRMVQLHPLVRKVVFLAIAAPWHILIALANPTQGHPGDLTIINGHWSIPLPTDGNVHGWLWFYFVNEQFLRYLNLRVPRDYDTVPLWLFWGLVLVWIMPWSAFFTKALGPLMVQWFRAIGEARLNSRMFRNNTAGSSGLSPIFISIWAAFILLFFSLSTRQEYYVLPALPAVAILIAGWLASDEQTGWQPVTPLTAEIRCTDLRVTAFLLVLGALFAAASLVFLLHTRAPSRDIDLAQLLQQNPANYALSMGHFLDLNAKALGFFRLPLALAALSLLFGPAASLVLRRRNQHQGATLALATGAFGFLLAAHLALQRFAPVLSSAQLAAAIAPQLHPDDLIVIHQEYEYASTLGFYLRRPGPAGEPIHILEGRSSNLWYGSFFPDAPRIFETSKSLAEKWTGPQRIFLWQDLGNQPSPLPPLPDPYYVIAKSGGKEIVSNQPNHP